MGLSPLQWPREKAGTLKLNRRQSHARHCSSPVHVFHLTHVCTNDNCISTSLPDLAGNILRCGCTRSVVDDDLHFTMSAKQSGFSCAGGGWHPCRDNAVTAQMMSLILCTCMCDIDDALALTVFSSMCIIHCLAYRLLTLRKGRPCSQ